MDTDMVSTEVLERLIGAVSVLATSPRPLQQRLRSACATHLSRIPSHALPDRFAAQLEFIVQQVAAAGPERAELPNQTASALAERVLILCVEALRGA